MHKVLRRCVWIGFIVTVAMLVLLNVLRATYRDGEDSHLNQLANQIIGLLFADFIVGAAGTYWPRPAE